MMTCGKVWSLFQHEKPNLTASEAALKYHLAGAVHRCVPAGSFESRQRQAAGRAQLSHEVVRVVVDLQVRDLVGGVDLGNACRQFWLLVHVGDG